MPWRRLLLHHLLLGHGCLLLSLHRSRLLFGLHGGRLQGRRLLLHWLRHLLHSCSPLRGQLQPLFSLGSCLKPCSKQGCRLLHRRFVLMLLLVQLLACLLFCRLLLCRLATRNILPLRSFRLLLAAYAGLHLSQSSPESSIVLLRLLLLHMQRWFRLSLVPLPWRRQRCTRLQRGWLLARVRRRSLLCCSHTGAGPRRPALRLLLHMRRCRLRAPQLLHRPRARMLLHGLLGCRVLLQLLPLSQPLPGAVRRTGHRAARRPDACRQRAKASSDSRVGKQRPGSRSSASASQVLSGAAASQRTVSQKRRSARCQLTHDGCLLCLPCGVGQVR